MNDLKYKTHYANWGCMMLKMLFIGISGKYFDIDIQYYSTVMINH